MPYVLVVDDSTSLRLILTELLHDAGYDVQQASNGLEALEIIATLAPDLVLSDIHMPHLDGLGLVTHLQRDAIPIPVILMSSALNAPDAWRGPFLAKPFDLDRLLTFVEDHLPPR